MFDWALNVSLKCFSAILSWNFICEFINIFNFHLNWSASNSNLFLIEMLLKWAKASWQYSYFSVMLLQSSLAMSVSSLVVLCWYGPSPKTYQSCFFIVIDTTKYFTPFFPFPANIYLFRGNNRKTKRRCEICFKLTRNIPDLINVVLMFLLLILDIIHTFFWCIYCWLWISKF